MSAHPLAHTHTLSFVPYFVPYLIGYRTDPNPPRSPSTRHPVGLDAGRLEWTNTHYRDRGGQGGRVGVTQFRWGVGELPSSPHIWVWLLFPSGSLSHKRSGSISTVEVGWFIHRFQPP